MWTEPVSFLNARLRAGVELLFTWGGFPCGRELPSAVTFTSAATWQEGNGKKGRVGRDGTFPEHSARAGCVRRESPLSVGNFSDLSRVGQALPKLRFFTPQRVTARGTSEGSITPAWLSLPSGTHDCF